MLHERLSRCRPAVRLPYLELNHRVRLRPGHHKACRVSSRRCRALFAATASTNTSLQLSSACGVSPPTCFLAPSLVPLHSSPSASRQGWVQPHGPISLANHSSADRDAALFASSCLPSVSPPLLPSCFSYRPSLFPFARGAAIVSLIQVGETHGRSLPNQGYQHTSPQPLQLTTPTTARSRSTRLALADAERTISRNRDNLRSHAAVQGGEKGAHARETGHIRRRDHRCAGRQGKPQDCASATVPSA